MLRLSTSLTSSPTHHEMAGWHASWTSTTGNLPSQRLCCSRCGSGVNVLYNATCIANNDGKVSL